MSILIVVMVMDRLNCLVLTEVFNVAYMGKNHPFGINRPTVRTVVL